MNRDAQARVFRGLCLVKLSTVCYFLPHERERIELPLYQGV